MNAEKNGVNRFEGIYRLGRQEFYIVYDEPYYYVVTANNYYIIAGDVIGQLTPTATSNVFLGQWAKPNATSTFYDASFCFTKIGLDVILGDDKISLIKVWPDANHRNHYVNSSWTGTGWSLLDGYIVTNYHVVENAKTILVNIFSENGVVKVPAKVIDAEQESDLAIIKIDKAFACPDIPYSVLNAPLQLGTQCYAYGYPHSDQLGTDIKVTEGIISSKNGYEGDVKTYQISAAVHPGNSGGPMLDKDCHVIGIVNSGVPGYDNVGYAIKVSYLYDILQKNNLLDVLPTNNPSITTSQMERICRCVYILECSNR